MCEKRSWVKPEMFTALLYFQLVSLLDVIPVEKVQVPTVQLNKSVMFIEP
jgi:hypothetical protein